jgi:hypothetical protein
MPKLHTISADDVKTHIRPLFVTNPKLTNDELMDALQQNESPILKKYVQRAIFRGATDVRRALNVGRNSGMVFLSKKRKICWHLELAKHVCQIFFVLNIFFVCVTILNVYILYIFCVAPAFSTAGGGGGDDEIGDGLDGWLAYKVIDAQEKVSENGEQRNVLFGFVIIRPIYNMEIAVELRSNTQLLVRGTFTERPSGLDVMTSLGYQLTPKLFNSETTRTIDVGMQELFPAAGESFVIELDKPFHVAPQFRSVVNVDSLRDADDPTSNLRFFIVKVRYLEDVADFDTVWSPTPTKVKPEPKPTPLRSTPSTPTPTPTPTRVPLSPVQRNVMADVTLPEPLKRPAPTSSLPPPKASRTSTMSTVDAAALLSTVSNFQ